MKNKIIEALCLLMILFTGINTHAQISIVTSNLNPVNVTPQTICQVNIMSQDNNTKVILEASIYNSSNEELMKARTQPLELKSGLNAGVSLAISLESFSYSPSYQGQYLQTNKILPSGGYKHCVRVIQSVKDFTNEFCQDLTSDYNSFLTLISPFDKDTIDSRNPFLIWNHSESFNLLSQGEYFRMTVVEMIKGQNAEGAINTNIPVYLKEYVTTHNVFYPFEAKELISGKKYAWQILKISNGNIINRSEAWEFVLAKSKPIMDNKYAILGKSVDGGFYLAENKKVFFKFNEEYVAGNLKCYIYNEKRELINPVVKNETENNSIDTKVNGYNRFEINLQSINLKKGYYYLEVYNEKNEKYLMKFYVE